MDSTTFDTMTVRLGRKLSRRGLIGKLAKAGAAAALAGVAGRAARPAAAATCPYGAFTCQQGYVWREAFACDIVCVEPWMRDQVAADNAAAPYRTDPTNLDPSRASCAPGYVFRDAYDGDGVCVEPWVRDQVHFDNSMAGARIEPGCTLETTT